MSRGSDTPSGERIGIHAIEIGKRADLPLLGKNPLESVDACDWIEAVFLAK